MRLTHPNRLPLLSARRALQVPLAQRVILVLKAIRAAPLVLPVRLVPLDLLVLKAIRVTPVLPVRLGLSVRLDPKVIRVIRG